MAHDAPKSIAEAVRRRFEQAWARGDEPAIEAVFPLAADPRFVATLEELVHVDLEFRWRKWAGQAVLHQAGSAPPAVESYLQRFPALRRPEIAARLALSEYQARRRAGQQPHLSEYLSRLTPGVLSVPTEQTVAPDAAPVGDSDPQRWRELLERELAALVSPVPGPTVSFDADGTQGVERRGQSTDAAAASGGGAQLAGYEIVSRLAEGGMGVVYKARQIGLSRIVALKMIRSGTYASADDVARFHREATAVAQLQHPHIVQIFEIGMQGQQPYFSMEFVEGGSLAARLSEKPWKSEAAARFMADVAAAVKFAHARKIIHRDLKPGNILLARRYPEAGHETPAETFNSGEWIPKITDFGLAKQLNLQDDLTQSEAILGTPCYMSPEQAQGRTAAVGPASDVYSLGAILYELLVGRPPFKAATPIETIRQVATLEPAPPRRHNPAIATDLETICLKCLSKEPTNRYADAGELFADLDRYLIGLPIQARHVSRPERALRWARRNPVPAGLAAAIVISLLLLGAVVLLNRQAGRLTTVDTVSASFEERLAAPSLAPEYLVEMDGLIAALQKLSPSRAADARERLDRRFAEHIEDVLLQPRISPQLDQELQAAVAALKSRRAELAAPLARVMFHRRRKQVFLYEPRERIQSVFPSPLLKDTPYGAVLSDTTPTSNRDLLTSAASRGNVELEATFGQDWQQAREIALLVNATASRDGRARGYRFTLQMTGEGNEPGRSFAEGQATAAAVRLTISRDGQTLCARHMPAADLTGSTLRLRASREGNRLTFQVNDVPPLEYWEIFLDGRRNEGLFGIGWPGTVVLQELRAMSYDSSNNESSPLEKGDSSFASGYFQVALERYEVQQRQTADPELADEIAFKRALCLLRLQRTREGEQELQQLAVASGVWPRLAAIQIWKGDVDAGRYSVAAETLKQWESRADFAELAGQVPPEALAAWLAHCRTPAGQSAANLQSALRLLEARSAAPREIAALRGELVAALQREGQSDEAQRQAALLPGGGED